MSMRLTCLLLLVLLLQFASFNTFAISPQDILRQFPGLTVEEWQDADQRVTVLIQPYRARKAAGTLILLPDRGQHAFYPPWFTGVQRLLPDHGWHIIGLPPINETVLASTFSEQKQKLAQHLQLLNRQQLPRPWLLIAQGEHAALSLHVLTERQSIPIEGVVSINAFFGDYALHQQLQPLLSDPRIPILDIVTSQSHPWAHAFAEQRRIHSRNQLNALYRQRVLNETREHQAQQHALIKEIVGWQRTMGF